MALIKLLTPEEASQLETVPIGKGHPVRRAIEALKEGEAIKIAKQAFTWAGHTPKLFCNEIEKKTTRRFQTMKILLDDQITADGWLVKRIK